MKKKGQEINEFVKLLQKKDQGNAKIQCHWGEVVSVDWETKTATVKGLADNLEFYDVLLGLGAVYTKPTIGSSCLIGVILNNEASTFLIQAEAVEEISFKAAANNTVLTVNETGVLISRNAETLKAVLNDLILEINKIIVIQGTSINVAAVNAIKQRLNTVLI